MEYPIPVTLLSGFLGAGKTTLINEFLKEEQRFPIAIVENEFGAANVDAALLNAGENVNIVELSNGCVCCSVRGEFTTAMLDLMEKRKKGLLEFEHIIIETTGLADPSPIAQAFFVDPQLRENMMLDSCVVLVDCAHIMHQIDEHPVVGAQIGFADRILLTKTDCVDEAMHQKVLSRLAKMNSKADIVKVIHGKCAKERWFNIGAFELSDNLTWFAEKQNQRGQFGAAQEVAAQAANATSWNDTIQSYLLEGGLMDIDHIGAWMENLVEDYGNDMLRYKGILAVQGEERRLIVQGVHKIVGFDYGSVWADHEERQSKLVIIGRNLPIDDLKQTFLASQA